MASLKSKPQYFLLETDERNPYPRVINWYGKIDPINANTRKRGEQARFTQLELMPQEKLIFTDVVSFPVFMVSQAVAQIIHYYSSNIEFRYITLIEKKQKQIQTYSLPMFAEIDCLHESSELNLDKSVIKKAVFDSSKIFGHPIFRLAGIEKTYIAARLDLVESLLRRDVVGLALTSITMI